MKTQNSKLKTQNYGNFSLRSKSISVSRGYPDILFERLASTKGLTLIEVLVAMGTAILVGVLLVVIIVQSAGMFTKQSSKVTVGLNVNDTLSQVRGAVKQASAVASSYTSGSTTYTSAAGQLVLKVAAVDSSNNIIADTFDFFVFLADGNILRFKIFPDVASFRPAKDQVLAGSVDSLYFQYLSSANPPQEVVPASATKVRVTLTLRQKVGQNFETLTSTSEANLRND